MSELPKLDVSIPEFSGHHPFSKGEMPKLYRPADLMDFAPGKTLRTSFFEKYLVALAWKLDGPVPYAFRTADNQVRSLDAGCLGFLAHRNPPHIEFNIGPDGIITGVLPTKGLSDVYERIRPKLLLDLQGKADNESKNAVPPPGGLEIPLGDTRISPALLEKAFSNRGFSRTNGGKVIALNHDRAPFPFYFVNSTRSQPSIQPYLVAHPDLSKVRLGILEIRGVKLDHDYYHSSNLQDFPKRMHRGKAPEKFGLQLEFETITALEKFLDVALGEAEEKEPEHPEALNVDRPHETATISEVPSLSNSWWVNQNQTLKEEIEGGYLWSPKASKNGVFNQFYENMKSVAPGDMIFSYANQKIGHVGQALGRAIEATKPLEFGSRGDVWSDSGWLVRVHWWPLAVPIRPKDFIEELIPTLPAKYSPLQKNGDGLQSVYLAAIPDEMAQVLLSKSNEIVELVSEELEAQAGELPDRLADRIEQALRNDTTIDSTECDSVIKARRGQGKFRRNVASLEKGCRITNVREAILLRASHIKPWSLCQTNHERLDGNNGLLLTPTFDVLFDRGLLTFSDDANVIISARVSSEVRALIGLEMNLQTKPPFNDNQKSYLAFHRANIFKP